MLDIIKVQLFRLKKSVLFWVIFAIIVALPILATALELSVIGITDTATGPATNPDLSGMDTMFGENNLTISFLNSIAQNSSNVAVLSIIAAAIILSHEFTDGTIRNILLANKTRGELYFGYLITSIIISLTFLVGSFVPVMIIVAPIFGFGDVTAGTAVSACFTSLALGIVAILFVSSCMCMFLFVARKQWAAILFPLLICFAVPVVIGFIVGLISATMIVKGQITSVEALTNGIRWIPFVGIEFYNCTDIDGVVVGMNILYLAIFTAIFITIGYFVFKKSDLK